MSLLYPTSRKLKVGEQKKVGDIWKVLTYTGIHKDYDKTKFYSHAGRVKNLGKLKEDVDTHNAKFTDIEQKIEIVEDMVDSLSEDAGSIGSANPDVTELAEGDIGDGQTLLGEHEATKKGILQNLRKLLKEYEF